MYTAIVIIITTIYTTIVIIITKIYTTAVILSTNSDNLRSRAIRGNRENAKPSRNQEGAVFGKG